MRGSKYWTENFMKYEKGRRKVEKSEGQLVIQGLVKKKVLIIFLPNPGEGSTCPNFPQVPTALKLDLILKNHQKIGWSLYKLLSALL